MPKNEPLRAGVKIETVHDLHCMLAQIPPEMPVVCQSGALPSVVGRIETRQGVACMILSADLA